MGLVDGLSSLFRKDANYTDEYNKFKKALRRASTDTGLKAQFIKFCLMNRFTKHEAAESHVSEAIGMFEAVEQSDHFDLQCYYLVGKYFQEIQDQRRAYRIYLNAIKRFNRTVVKNPELKAENVELAYSISLNVMALQLNPVDPDLELCFKLIRKSFPLHLKRVELENEMGKPAPDPARVKQLSEEVRNLKAEEEKIAQAVVEEKKVTLAAEEKKVAILAEETKKAEAAGSNGKEPHADGNGKEAPDVSAKEAAAPAVLSGGPKGIFSKLFSDLSPAALGLSGPVKMDAQGKKGTEKGPKDDSLKISPLYDYTNGATFMAYHGDRWEGPYTAFQLRSMDFFKPATWICRVGSQQVIQAYEAPEILPLFQHQV